jgi:two-component system response regulator FlrC
MPLKDRMGDILPMALSCLQRHGKAGEVWTLSAEAQTLLLNHAWPGNVRELENVMRRAMVLCPDKTIGPEHLMFDDLAPQPTQTAQTCAESQHTPMTLVPMEPVTRPPAPIEVQDLHSATRVNEHQVIMATLAQTHNREEAARKLGISPRTLRYKLAQFKAMGMAA